MRCKIPSLGLRVCCVFFFLQINLAFKVERNKEKEQTKEREEKKLAKSLGHILMVFLLPTVLPPPLWVKCTPWLPPPPQSEAHFLLFLPHGTACQDSSLLGMLDFFLASGSKERSFARFFFIVPHCLPSSYLSILATP